MTNQWLRACVSCFSGRPMMPYRPSQNTWPHGGHICDCLLQSGHRSTSLPIMIQIYTHTKNLAWHGFSNWLTIVPRFLLFFSSFFILFLFLSCIYGKNTSAMPTWILFLSSLLGTDLDEEQTIDDQKAIEDGIVKPWSLPLGAIAPGKSGPIRLWKITCPQS